VRQAHEWNGERGISPTHKPGKKGIRVDGFSLEGAPSPSSASWAFSKRAERVLGAPLCEASALLLLAIGASASLTMQFKAARRETRSRCEQSI